MFKAITSASAAFTTTVDIPVTAGAPYVLFLDGTFTNCTVAATATIGGSLRNMPLTAAALTTTSPSITFFAPTNNIFLTATGTTTNSIVYLLRMTVQPVLHVGSTSYV